MLAAKQALVTGISESVLIVRMCRPLAIQNFLVLALMVSCAAILEREFDGCISKCCCLVLRIARDEMM